jgi:hypothetical protein
MKYFICCCVTFWFFNTYLAAQPNYALIIEKTVQKPAELIKLQNQRHFYPVGYNNHALIYQMNRQGTTSSGLSAEAMLKVYYDEKTKQVRDSIDLRKTGQKIIKINQVGRLTMFHGLFKIPHMFEDKPIDELDRGEYLQDYQDVWLEKDSTVCKLKSFEHHYYDQDVEYSIEYSGKYILVSTFVSEYLRSTTADSVIFVFDLSNADKITNREIYCTECIKPQIVGNYIYYGKKFYYLPGADAYDWKLYRAPIFDLSKSELLAEYVELISVTPDGKYAIGKKLLYGKETFIILNIKTKKFQYILGRDYTKYKLFYSSAYQQFALDQEEQIIYIEYPKQYPFNSIGVDAEPKQTSDTEDAAFWKKFVHPD